MNQATRAIFRSWNWPNKDNNTFSSKPTPYSIYKNYKISPTTAYSAWESLFDNGFVKDVLLMPSNLVAARTNGLIIGALPQHVEKLKSLIKELYFLELVHYGNVYSATGVMEPLMRSGTIISIELVQLPRDVNRKNMKILMEILKDDQLNLTFRDPVVKDVDFDLDKYWYLLKEIYYHSLYKVDLDEIAERNKKSPKTVRRHMDQLLQMDALFAYPILDQKTISGFNLFVLNIALMPGEDINKFSEVLFSESTLTNRRYLLHRIVDDGMVMLLYYERLSEIDEIMNEFRKYFISMSSLTNFYTLVNPWVTLGIE